MRLMAPDPPPRTSLAGLLALNRTVGVILITVLFFGVWGQAFGPAHLGKINEGRFPTDEERST